MADCSLLSCSTVPTDDCPCHVARQVIAQPPIFTTTCLQADAVTVVKLL